MWYSIYTMIHSPITRKLINLKNAIFPVEIVDEVIISYNHRLPSNVEVSWFRDGDFIIGNINAEGKHFMTQAQSADEFVEMVNDALYAVYKIPTNYPKLTIKKLMPPLSEYKKLNDASVKSSVIGFQEALA